MAEVPKNSPSAPSNSAAHIASTNQYSAHNYAPLEVVLARGAGAWTWDVDENRYLDFLSAYSALNFGHANPRLLAALQRQAGTLALTSRAFYNDQLGAFCEALATLCRLEMVLPMNTGAEAVETAIKAARRWGYYQKKVTADSAEIICFENNFHGRTTTIVGFSSSSDSREGFGPFTPGFRLVPFGDERALTAAINKNTVGILIEPIQGEGGIIIPPDGFLARCREICDESNVLFIADEIQTGLCRTGALFACDHEGVRPDILIIGKSLGGGLLPISAVVGTRAVMETFTPGSHGSTFGGNPLACAVASEVIRIINEELPHDRARELGNYFMNRLRPLVGNGIVTAVRGRGLLVGVDIAVEAGNAKKFCKKLLAEGVLSKDTRDHTIRFAPPLIIAREDLDWGIERVVAALS